MAAHNVAQKNPAFQDWAYRELHLSEFRSIPFLRRSVMTHSSLTYPCYARPPREDFVHAALLKAYEIHLIEERGVIKADGQIRVAYSFLTLLEASHSRLDEISVAHIQRFITEQGHHYQRRTVASIASYLRGFLRYLAFKRLTSQDLSESVRRPCVFHGEREPRYLQDWQVCQVLSAVERNTAKGKRDYAMLLLLAVYGLRSNEVVGLRLDDCRWEARQLLIRQRKCGDSMQLPLTAEVAEALIAYLRVRVQSEHREVFLNFFRPHQPLRTGGLSAVAITAIRRCGFVVARPGSHTFRYSRAQALFAAERSLPEIASMLGHRDLRTTLGYLSFTVHPLRELALSAGEGLA